MTHLIFRRILFTAMLLITFALSFQAADNPFLKMIDRPYASYMQEMRVIRYNIDYVWDRETIDSTLRQMQEAVAIAKSEHWELEGRLLQLACCFRNEQLGSPQVMINGLKEISHAACLAKDTIMFLRAQHELLYAFWYLTKEYEEAFELASALTRELEVIPLEVLPEKLFCYRLIGDMYYLFRDYDNAGAYYDRLLKEPQQASELHLLQSAYNGLALIARYRDNDLEASNRYLHLILSLAVHPTASKGHTAAWEGIARGNIGYNCFLAKRYNEAIVELEFSHRRMAELADYTFAGKMAEALAESYLALDNIAACKQTIDRIEGYNQKVGVFSSQTPLYPLLCRYYLKLGNTKLGEQYLDSAMVSQKRSSEEFNMLKLIRAEQRNHKFEQQARVDERMYEQSRLAHYKQTIIGIVIGMLVVILLASFLAFLLIRNRKAYRMLALKNCELATSVQPHGHESGENPEEESEEAGVDADTRLRETELHERICRSMKEQKLYTRIDLNLTSLSDMLDERPVVVSNAINHCAGMNVTQFIHEYRINAAIRVLSDPKKSKITIDMLATQVGFNNRKSFHRAFKKQTGLTPSEFRQSIPDGL